MKPKLSNPRPLLWIACIMLVTVLMTSCNNEATQTEEPKTDSVPAATTPAPVTPDSSTIKKDSLPPIDTTAQQKPDTKKT